MPNPKEPPLPPEIRTRLENLGDGATATAEDWKCIGNACFAHGCHLSAIRYYSVAIEKGEDTAVLRSNRSAAYLKSPMFAGPSLALKDAERAVELDAGWYKAHLRVGDAQFARKKYEEAKTAYQKALELNSSCEVAVESLRLVEREIFLRSLDEQEKERKKKKLQEEQEQEEVEEDEGEMPTRKGIPSDWSANSTMSGTNMTASTKSGNDRPPTLEEEVQRNIHLWTKDTTTYDDRTAMRAFNARIEEADRQTGVAYKNALLSKFRGKLDQQDTLRRTVAERHEQQMRVGEGIDYRNADNYRTMYMKGTDGVGMGISTDAYKSYKYESKMW
ncbi:Tetratricopeptide repeat 1 [Trypanosoma melophagium]|uniref:Tetratricopeptide repeat 1 n=1 Tax=Trypanosoma melophagium TaxID=715481 RepID=UPI00351AAC0E|nr:Tetratricopeptide repeat 1 [Trypanosoma melophagium]